MIVVAVDVSSRGRLRLRSADPRAKAAIDPAYLADQADLDVLVAGVRQAREVAACQPFAGLTAGELAPGDRPRDDRGLRAWVRGNVTTIFHPTSSCAMGASDAAVCDRELRVRGVDRLRVVDAGRRRRVASAPRAAPGSRRRRAASRPPVTPPAHPRPARSCS
jgi:choline dehydrogenase